MHKLPIKRLKPMFIPYTPIKRKLAGYSNQDIKNQLGKLLGVNFVYIPWIVTRFTYEEAVVAFKDYRPVMPRLKQLYEFHKKGIGQYI